MKYVGSMICTAVNCSQLHDTSATSTVRGGEEEGEGEGERRRTIRKYEEGEGERRG